MISTKAYAAMSPSTPLVPWTLERRQPGTYDVQIEILFCGVCHSDLHTAKNEWNGSIYPVVPGHEIVGKVLAVGEGVLKYQTGDLVGVGCMVDSCQHCDSCKEGLEQYCEEGSTATYNSKLRDNSGISYGGYSGMITVREDFVLRIPDNLPLEGVAPLLCAGITTYSPLRHWKAGKGMKVGVVGLGGLGHMAVKLAVAMGCEVTLISRSPSKEADMKQLGGHHFILSTDHNQMKKAKNNFDLILDTVSAIHDYNDYLHLVKRDGTMVCLGGPPTGPGIESFNLIGKRRSLAGSLIGGIAETQEMLDFCAAHQIVREVEVIDMDYINEAYTRMLKGDVRYRFVIDMASLEK